jgi:hypothetical protein
MGWASFWATFSQKTMVTLRGTFLSEDNACSELDLDLERGVFVV